MQHRPSIALGKTEEETRAGFQGALAGLRQRERATGQTAAGPHRDDFKIFVEDVDAGVFASRGEARTLALTLRLAEASYLAAVREDEPIVLLDDVLSEMDGSRRQRVLEKIGGYGQTIISTTDLEPMREFFGANATYFQVDGGTVTPLDIAT